MHDVRVGELADQTNGMRLLTDSECDNVSGGLLFLLGLVFAAEVGTYIGTELYFALN